jgi:hypothetical protein
MHRPLGGRASYFCVMLRLLCFSLLLGGLAPLCGCSASSASRSAGSETAPAGTASDSPPAAPSSDSISWLVADSAAKTAELSIEVTRPPDAASALLNGHRRGEARIIIPLGWTVRWNWRNADSSSRHSLVVMGEREKVPLEGGRPAFSNAMTRMVTEGLPPGETDQTTFEAEEAGWYWFLCGVPSHALEGEWLELRVDPEATSAGVRIKSGEK